VKAKTTYRVREFAELAGVTVRALHHYDRLGLLAPSGRTDSGYRLYTERDLARFEQIVVLKFLGLPLKGIRGLLRSEAPLPATLRRQRAVLTDKRWQLDQAIRTIATAQQTLESNGRPDWRTFIQIIKEIEMQNETDWSKKYYSPDAQAKVEEGKARWSPELQAEVSQKWTALYADIEAALGEDPVGPKAQALAARWRALVQGFTGGDPEVQRGLNKMWADQANWPAGLRSQYQIKPEIQDFIVRAMKATRS